MRKEEDNKIYVFLSHSRNDYEKVRKVRDLLENEGFRPLMFFLKCLEKKENEQLTKSLIKEEINCRQRFILCNSKNANNSNWVKFEIKHIKETNRPYEVIDLDWPNSIIENAILTFKKRCTVFLSYPRELQKLAKAVNEELKLHDYRTFFDMDDLNFRNMGSWPDIINNQIVQASEEGYVLVFIDESIKKETFQRNEISIALKTCQANSKKRIIPVWTSQSCDYSTLIDSNLDFLKELININGIDVYGMNIRDAAKKIAEKLTTIDIEMNQLDDKI